MKDEEVAQIFQKLQKKVEGAVINMQEVVNEATNVMAFVINEKNKEIEELKAPKKAEDKKVAEALEEKKEKKSK